MRILLLIKAIQPDQSNAKYQTNAKCMHAFHAKWKVDQVTPLHKGGQHRERNNYRPISVLPVQSKIIEKHVANSLLNYLQENICYLNYTQPSVLVIPLKWLLSESRTKFCFKMVNDEVTGLAFVDFRKAFDVINHNLSLKKLSMYGASPDSVAWFRSYLEELRQFAKLGHIKSEPKPVRPGVPQGSILGPVLLLLFVNDIPLHLNNSTTDIYADDTILSLSANWNNITSLTQALSNDLEVSRNGRLKTKCTLILSIYLSIYLPLLCLHHIIHDSCKLASGR